MVINKKKISIVLSIAILFMPWQAYSMQSANYRIDKDSINFGGTEESESDNYKMSDTMGEIGTGESSEKCSSLSFDGSDDYASMPQENMLHNESLATISTWFKTADTSGAIIAQYSMSGNYGYKFNIDDGKIKACFGTTSDPCTNTGDFDVAYDANVNDNSWHHAVITYNGSAIVLYVDGVERNSKSKTGAISYYRTYGNIIGSMGYIYNGNLNVQGNGYLNGQVDDLRIYSRNLSADEIQNLYFGKDISNSGLRARWNFNEGSGAVIYDASGNNQNGTLINGPVYSDSYPEAACSVEMLNTGYREMEGSYLSISSPSDVAMSPAIGGISGGIGNGSATWKVTTDNAAGYQLSVRAGSNPALQSGAYSFANYNNVGDSQFDWLINSTDSAFGFTVEGDNTVGKFLDNGLDTCGVGIINTADKCWYGFSASDETVINASSANHPLGSDAIIKLRAESGADHMQESGTYTATIIVTAVAL